jgi:hypothetical protein
MLNLRIRSPIASIAAWLISRPASASRFSSLVSAAAEPSLSSTRKAKRSPSPATALPWVPPSTPMRMVTGMPCTPTSICTGLTIRLPSALTRLHQTGRELLPPPVPGGLRPAPSYQLKVSGGLRGRDGLARKCMVFVDLDSRRHIWQTAAERTWLHRAKVSLAPDDATRAPATLSYRRTEN